MFPIPSAVVYLTNANQQGTFAEEVGPGGWGKYVWSGWPRWIERIELELAGQNYTLYRDAVSLADLAQVWAGTPKRNASISSATSATDVSPSHMGEHWTTTRGTNGAWEEVNGSPNRNDMSQLVIYQCYHSDIEK